MLVQMAPGTEQRARRIEAEGRTPFLVPDWYADRMARQEFAERGKRIVREMVERERLARDTAYQEQRNRDLRDTRPVAFMDTTDPSRPVIVVGAGTAWREDLRDLALRVKEKPDPKADPIHRERANVLNTLDMMAEASKWKATGRTAVWHIRNNPLRSD